MIQPISSNINFAGKISIGKNLYDKAILAESISSLPKNIQNDAVFELNNLKETLEANTPEKLIGYIDAKIINGVDNKLENTTFTTTFYRYYEGGGTIITGSSSGNIVDENGDSAIEKHCKQVVDAACGNNYYKMNIESKKIFDRLA